MESARTISEVAAELETELDMKAEVFGKYHLARRLATGGMAEVWLGMSTSIDGFSKNVAVKRILPELSTDAEFISMFIAEAKLAVQLSHGNIVQVFDFGRVDHSYYIAMELIEGRDMTQVLVKQSRRNEQVPIEVACMILADVLKGLEYAHTRRGQDGRPLGIVHRDVSPHNILVSYDGEVKLTDFGIAKAKSHVSLQKPGIVFGKFAYMSPEQANGLEVDARSDVYSAGIALYETLTGRRLFYSDDPVKTLAKVRRPRVPPASKYNPRISADLDALVMKSLAPAAAERFQSARDFAAALISHQQAVAPEFNQFHLSHFMKELFEDEVGAAKFPMAEPRPMPRKPKPSTAPASEDSLGDPVLSALAERLHREPNLWALVELGERLGDRKRQADAVRALKVAAVKFAQNGLLVQSLALYVTIREHIGWNAKLAAEVSILPSLAGRSNEAVLALLPVLEGEGAFAELLGGVFFASGPSTMAAMLTSPLFSFLEPDELTNLVSMLRLRRVPPATVVITEGDASRSIYIVARGRMVIYCKNFDGEKVYLTSISDGDCVGEFSFFTGELRAATVETLEECLLFEIDPADFDRIMSGFPNLTSVLLRFYKERVVTTLLAKSEVFGVLPPRSRAALLDRFQLERRGANEVVIEEGEISDGFYLIKSGEVEVFSRRGGYVFLGKLKAGDSFGEIAMVTGRPRTAVVRTRSATDLLKLSGADLQQLQDDYPELREVLRRRVAQREAETARRITAGGLLV
ncbi:MAG: cyclic nucleotide-binding domain-containing protein [Deltaproteobacteria bacterium]|nr:cyclic nucleotide-binding domain-containing protein [Deltaproteobacteria bacterium]